MGFHETLIRMLVDNVYRFSLMGLAIVIFLDKPFQVGDVVRVADQYGEVREITMRTTRIRTRAV